MSGSKPIAKPVLVDEPGAVGSPTLDGSGLHVGLVYAHDCADVVEALLMACRGELLLKGVSRANIHELHVLKPYDIPYAVKRMLQSSPVPLDAVVCIGCLVRGKSLAFEFAAEAVTRACMKIGMKTKTPVVYGVLTCTDQQQARQCAGLGKHGSKTRACNFGVEWAQSAIAMGHLNRQATRKMLELCACACHSASQSASQSTGKTETAQEGGKISEGLTDQGYPKAPCGWCGHEDERGHHGQQQQQPSHGGPQKAETSASSAHHTADTGYFQSGVHVK